MRLQNPSRLTFHSRFEEITDEPQESKKPEAKKRPRDEDTIETGESKLTKAQQDKERKAAAAAESAKKKAEAKALAAAEEAELSKIGKKAAKPKAGAVALRGHAVIARPTALETQWCSRYALTIGRLLLQNSMQ